MWKEQFISLMSNSTITFENIDNAYSLKEEHIPALIYKYRPVSQHSLDNLENDTVWVCSASNYNDPYDCCTTIDTQELSRKTSINNFDDISKFSNLDSHLSDVEITRAKKSDNPLREISLSLMKKDESIDKSSYEIFQKAIAEASEHVSDDMIRRMNDNSQRGMKVCSFSERNDSIVMWGHYSLSHTGFCLEYSLQELGPDDLRRRLLHPVTYSPKLFDATAYLLQSMESDSFNNLFGVIAGSRKAPDWSYEEEWRLLLPMGESFEDHNYSMPKPSSIYLGTRISGSDERRVREIAERRKIPVKKMKLSQREFKLIPESE